MGMAVAGLCPSASAASAVANAIILPMAFVSDIFIAIEDPPPWLDTLGDILPLKPFAQSFQDAFNPSVAGAGVPVGQAGARRRLGRRRAARCAALVQVGAFARRLDRAAARSRRRRPPNRPDHSRHRETPGGPLHPELTEEHEALRAVVREFAEAEIEPHAEAWDRDHTFPVDTVRKMGALGLFGIPFPEPYGGGGGDLTGLCVAIEELARVDQSLAITLEAGVGLGANPIHKFGTPEQQERWLPDLCAGRALGGFGLTEPDAGSDAGGTRTRADARRVDGGVGDRRREVVHHQLGHADHVDRHRHRAHRARARSRRSSCRPGRPGFEVAAAVPQDGLARLGHPRADVRRVPGARRRTCSGTRGRGFAQFLEILDEGRVAIAALAVGVIQRCLDDSVAYANERQTFGRPIGANQGVAFRCADMHVRRRRPRRLVYHAAWLRTRAGRSRPRPPWPSCSPPRRRSTPPAPATQVFGGYGFMDETVVSRHYRDAKILEIGEGTSEVQRMVISRALGLRV